MSTISVENEDLQTYLDSFNKEIEGNASLVTLTPEAVEALAGADAVTQKILQVGGEDLNEEDGTYFVDQEGNYYFQTAKEMDVKIPKASATAGGKATRKTCNPKNNSLGSKRSTKAHISASKIAEAETNNDEEDGYIIIMENGEVKNVRASDTTDPDDPDPVKEIYDFNESESGFEQCVKDEVKIDLMPGKVIRLKPRGSASDQNGVVQSCIHCEYTCKKRYLLSRHMKTHTEERSYKCSVCERGFKTNSSLMNHINTHLGNRPHACKFCESCFTTSGELVRHMRYRHTGEKPHKCSECDYCSVELSKLRRHMRCHTGERPYQCPHCTYASPDTFKLKRHMRTHTGEKPYECDICHARFTQSNSLKGHKLIHSVGDKPIFQCSICPTTCGRKTDLRLHIQKLHNSEHPFKCKRCGKELPDRYSYKVHIKTHEGEKCFRCELCPYASVSMRHLESHVLIHSNEKPFLCEICKMSFRQRQLLTRHTNLYHTKDYVPPKPREKVHSCPDCKRSFTHKGNLMRHMQIHDPDSNVEMKKMKLKIGHMSDPHDDGFVDSIAADKIWEVNDEENEEDGEEDIDAREFEYEDQDTETYEIIETLDDELDEKPIITNEVVMKDNQNAAVIKHVSFKREPDCKKFMTMNVGDDEQYMVVEVIQCDEDEEEVDDIDKNYSRVNNAGSVAAQLPISSKGNNADVANCFGFDVEDDDEYADDPDEPNDTKESIQLLDIIDDD